MKKHLIHEELVSIHALRSFNKETQEWGDALDPHFSWSPCENCGDHLGGDRFDCEALALVQRHGRQSLHKLSGTFACCPSCVEKWQ